VGSAVSPGIDPHPGGQAVAAELPGDDTVMQNSGFRSQDSKEKQPVARVRLWLQNSEFFILASAFPGLEGK
jgi:hypothetical protein